MANDLEKPKAPNNNPDLQTPRAAYSTPPGTTNNPQGQKPLPAQRQETGLLEKEITDSQELARQLCSNKPEEQQSALAFLAANQYKGTYQETLISLAEAIYNKQGPEGAQTLLRALHTDTEIMGLQHNLLQLRCLNKWLQMGMEDKDLKILEKEFRLLKTFNTWLKQGWKQRNKGDMTLHHILLRAFPQLGSVLGKSQAIALYNKALKDTDWRIRHAAAEALGALAQDAPEKASEIIPGLQKSLEDTDYDVRKVAAEALGALVQAAPDEPLLIPSFEKALENPSVYVRQAAIEALGDLAQAVPEKASEIIPGLQKALEDTDSWSVRKAAAEALGDLAQAAPDEPLLIPSLVKALENPSVYVRQAAIEALGDLAQAVPEKASEIIPGLQKALEDTDSWRVRKVAAEALGALVQAAPDEPLLIPSLVKALEDTDYDVRKVAAEALGALAQAAPEKASEIIPGLQKALENPSVYVRHAAAKALGDLAQAIPEKAKEILPSLVKALEDTDSWRVRQAAIEALGAIAQDVHDKAKEMIPSLLKALKDTDWFVRQAAVKALGALVQAAPDEPLLIPSFEKALENPSVYVRHAAAKALGDLAQAVPEKASEIIPGLQKSLEDTDYDVRKLAAEALGAVAQAAPDEPLLIPSLVKALENPSVYVRYAAAKALGDLAQAVPEKASEIIPGLQKALEDTDYDVREAVVEALRTLAQAVPEKASEIIPGLQKALEDTDSDVDEASVEALGALAQAVPEKASEIIPGLQKALEDTDSDVDEASVEALGAQAQAALDMPLLIPSFEKALENPSVYFRQAVVEALQEVIKASPYEVSEIIPSLQKALGDTDRWIRKAAVEALGDLAQAAPEKAKEILPSLEKALRDEDEDVRQTAVVALQKVIKASPYEVSEIIPSLQKALRDEDKGVRQTAVEALGDLAQAAPEKAKEILPSLVKALENPSVYVRQTAVVALGAIAQDAPDKMPEIIPVLRKALKDKDSWHVRKAAAQALGAIAQDAPDKMPEIIPVLRKALKDKDSWHVRKAAAEALGAIAQDAPDKVLEIIPVLLKALKDKGEDVREAAAEALGEVAKFTPDKMPEIIPGLRKALRDEDEDVRQAAEQVLGAYPTKTLIETYLASAAFKKLGPIIKERLYREALVTGPLKNGQYTLTLYPGTGQPEAWQVPKNPRIKALKNLGHTPASRIQTKKDIQNRVKNFGKAIRQRFGKQTGKAQGGTSREPGLSLLTFAAPGPTGPTTTMPPKVEATLLEKMIAELNGEKAYGLIKNRSIDLSRQFITNTATLAQALKKTTVPIHLLNLKDNTISDKGAEHLINLLKAKTGIIGLDLRGNAIKKELFKEINQCLANNRKLLLERIRKNKLKPGDTTTEGILDLSHYNLTPKAIKQLSTALATNTTLTTVDLRGNQIDNEGAHYLRKLFKQNTTLTNLYFDKEAVFIKTTIKDINNYLARNRRLFALECIRTNPHADTVLIKEGILDLSGPLSLLEAGKGPNTPLTFPEVEQLTQALTQKATLTFPEVEKVGQVLQVNIPTLTGLNLSHANIKDRGATELAKGLGENTTLSMLELQYNDIGAGGMAALAPALHNKTSITYLNLQGNTIRTKGIQALANEFLQNNTTLRVLNLSNNEAGDEGIGALSKVLTPGKTGLKELALQSNNICQAGAGHLNVILSNNNTLEKLDLRGNKLSNGGVTALVKGLGQNKTLRFLDLSHNRISNDGAKALVAALKENKTLTEINLLGNPIEKDTLKNLEYYLDRNHRLELLHLLKHNQPNAFVSKDGVLDFNDIKFGDSDDSDHYIEKLCKALQTNTTVKTLKLRNTGAGIPEMTALATLLKENPTIKKLDLSYNSITDEALHSLSEVLENSALEVLNLEGNRIGAEGARLLQNSLISNATLRELNLKGNNLGNSGAERIAVALQLQVERGEPVLEALNLEDNSITQLKFQKGAIQDQAGESLNRAIGRNTALKSIRLQDNNISLGYLRGIQASLERNNGIIPRAPRRHSNTPVAASGTAVTDIGFDALLKRIRTDDLTTKDKDEAGATDLSNYTLTFEKIGLLNKALKENQEITALNLGKTPITDLEAYALGRLAAQNDHLIKITFNDTVVQQNILIRDINSSLDRNRMAWNLKQLAAGNPESNIRLGTAGILNLNRPLNDKEIKGVAAVIANNKALKGLNLQNTNITATQIKSLTGGLISRIESGKPQLKSLDLSDNSLKGDKIEVLTKLLQAKNGLPGELNLTRNPIGSDIESLLPALQKSGEEELKVLTLESTDMHLVNPEHLESLLRHQTLEVLNLSRNQLGDGGAEAISAGLGANQQLHTLDLSNNGIRNKGIGELAKALKSNTTLCKLDLSYNQLSKAGAIALRDMLKGNKALTELSLLGNPNIPGEILDDIEDYLDRNRRDELLQLLEHNQPNAFVNDGVLDLSGIALDGGYIEKLGKALASNTTVKALNLKNTGTGTPEMTALAKLLGENSRIIKLDLSWNTIDAKGLYFFSKVLKEGALEELNLEGNQIGPQGARLLQDSLVGNTTLKALNLKRNNLGNNGAKRIAVALQLQAERGGSALEDNSITPLKFQKGAIRDEAGESLSKAISRNTALKSLKLGGNRISPAYLEGIRAGLKRNNGETSQAASHKGDAPAAVPEAATTDEGFLKFLGRIKTGNLTAEDKDKAGAPDLSSYTLTFEKIELLNEALKENQGITRLNLGKTPITDLGAYALSKLAAEHNHLISIDFEKKAIQHNILIEDIKAELENNRKLHALKQLGTIPDDASTPPQVEGGSLDFRNLFLSGQYLEAINTILKVNPTLNVLDLSGTNSKDASISVLKPGIQQSQGLKALNLKGNNITHEGLKTLVEALETGGNTLSNLDLGNNGIDAIDKDTLKTLLGNKTLEVLNLSRNQLGDGGAEAISAGLGANQQLHTLDLSNNGIRNKGIGELAEALKSNTTLCKLDLSYNQLSKAGAEYLKDMLKGNKTLTELRLLGNPNIPGEILDDIEDYLNRNRRLELLELLKKDQPNAFVDKNGVLDFSGITLGEEYISELGKALRGNTTVKELNLNGTGIGPDGIRLLADSLQSNKTLEVLHLEGNQIKPEGAGALAGMLEHNGVLKKLMLKNNLIGDDGISYLGKALEKNATLVELHVDNNNITVVGIKPLELCLIENTRLKTLGLSYNPISNEGVIRLALVLFLQARKGRATLEALDLKDCVIGNIGAQALNSILGKNTAVKTLNLEDNAIRAGLIGEINRRLLHNGSTSGAQIHERSRSTLSEKTDITQGETWEQFYQSTPKSTRTRDTGISGFTGLSTPGTNTPDTGTRDNAFNQLDNPGYWYQAADIRMVQEGGFLSGFSLSCLNAQELNGVEHGANTTRLGELLNQATAEKPSLCIYNKGGNHWVSFAVVDRGGEKVVLYKDSLGGVIDPALQQLLTKHGVNGENIHVHPGNEQETDVSHCGIFALENINRMAGGLSGDPQGFIETFEQAGFFCTLEDAQQLRQTDYAGFYLKGVVAMMREERRLPATIAGLVRELCDTLHINQNLSRAVQQRFVGLVKDVLVTPEIAQHFARDIAVMDEGFITQTLETYLAGGAEQRKSTQQGAPQSLTDDKRLSGASLLKDFTKPQNAVPGTAVKSKEGIGGKVGKKLESICDSLFEGGHIHESDKENLEIAVQDKALNDPGFREAFLKGNFDTVFDQLKAALETKLNISTTLTPKDAKGVVETLAKSLVPPRQQKTRERRKASVHMG
ncbi:sister chromatid cohesion protein PDS5 [Abyssalbus ytuae]|uniref:HEAT repeat domain-containing protein n=1 Tax=Abyssalbus ytuae TaxID=2926907 RepID=A0A9E7D0Z2_9FLAO|nr:sister chromatid cohesion protein PDS5 [Abyssalbus ytuae]UOB16523.1 HEAT repeat domain-containing protein [Abyssalbus ytuae]